MGSARGGQARVYELVGQGVQRAVFAVAYYVVVIAALASVGQKACLLGETRLESRKRSHKPKVAGPFDHATCQEVFPRGMSEPTLSSYGSGAFIRLSSWLAVLDTKLTLFTLKGHSKTNDAELRAATSSVHDRGRSSAGQLRHLH